MKNNIFELNPRIHPDTYSLKKGSDIIMMNLHCADDETIVLKNLYADWWQSLSEKKDLQASFQDMTVKHGKSRIAELENLVMVLVTKGYMQTDSTVSSAEIDEKLISSSDYVLKKWEVIEQTVKLPLFAQYGVSGDLRFGSPNDSEGGGGPLQRADPDD